MKTLRTYTEREALADQRAIIADIASGVPVDDVLRRIALFAEQHAPDGMAVNIMIYDEATDTLDGSGGQPSLPDSFTVPIRGLRPGPSAGSCGTAAYRREQVITPTIAGDPLWKGYEDFMAAHGFGSSWSTPILTPDGRLLGTFGMYHPHADRRPTANELALIDLFVYLAALAIQRHLSDRILRERAGSDWLTGLYHQRAFLDLADAAIAASPPSLRCGMLFVDIEDLEGIVDAYGHKVADDVLRDLADRLRAELPADVPIARSTEGAFVVFVCSDDPAELGRIAKRTADVVRTPFEYANLPFRPAAAIGVASAVAGITAEELLKRASLASSHARRLGRASIATYEPAMADKFRTLQQVIVKLRDAIDRRAIGVAYQPIVELESGRIVAVEALARWSVAAPNVFIPVAEKAGLVHDIGMIVLERAIADASAWIAEHAALALHVNLSPQQLVRPHLTDEIVALLERYAFPQDRLVLELTEEADLSDEEAGATIQGLSDAGIRLSLDDFGTGYASPSRLRGAPYADLKIDRSFVALLERSETDVQIVRLLMAFGREFHVPVIAEGVETEAQRAILIEMGCREAQGFLFSRPLTAAEFTALLAA